MNFTLPVYVSSKPNEFPQNTNIPYELQFREHRMNFTLPVHVSSKPNEFSQKLTVIKVYLPSISITTMNNEPDSGVTYMDFIEGFTI